ncbi:MAG: response regulator transcription factor [Verrucomicrobiales bacterium]|nr:response regulator transcription factor [Verrucomicrobiales bacterium]
MLRVLIVEDHELVRRGLRHLLAAHLPELTIVEAPDANTAIDRLIREEWQLVMLDVELPGRSGLEVLEESRRLQPKTPVLVLTAHPEEQFAVRAFKLGAAGYLTKQAKAGQLITAVQRVLAGGKYVSAELAERLATDLGSTAPAALHETLSSRELQVLRLIALGKTMKEIARDLALSEKTVATYRTRITEKTGLRTGVEIARYALKHRLVE